MSGASCITGTLLCSAALIFALAVDGLGGTQAASASLVTQFFLGPPFSFYSLFMKEKAHHLFHRCVFLGSFVTTAAKSFFQP
jgi:hypothetical protein